MKKLLFCLFFLPVAAHSQLVEHAPMNWSYTPPVVPSLSASPTSINGMVATFGTAGTLAIDTLTFSGTSGNSITVSTTGPFEASVDGGSTFGTSWGITTGSPYKVRVRINNSASVGPVSGTLTYTCTACGVSPVSVALSGTVSSSGSSADTFRFAMSLTPQTVPTGFVSLSGDPSTGVRTAVNSASTITISTVATANWSQVSSMCANDADGLTGSTVAGFPDNILMRQMFTYSGSAHTADSATQTLSHPNFTITGLNPSATYHIEVTACLSTSFNLSTMNKYRILGLPTTAYIGVNPDGVNGQFLVNATPGTFPRGAGGNTSKKIVFNSVTPDATGKLSLYLFTESGEELGIANACVGWKN